MSTKTEAEGYRGRRRHLTWQKAVLALLLIGVVTFGGLFGAVLLGAYDQVNGDPEFMVILGCQVKPWGPSVLLQDRLDEALEYWEDHPNVTVVVSGGQGPDEPTTEARAMADELMRQGIPEECILLEEQSHNTMQNFRYSKELLERGGYDLDRGVLVVSNGFHLTRARMLAQRTGYKEVSTLAAPASHLPSRLKMYVREPLALVKSFVFDW